MNADAVAGAAAAGPKAVWARLVFMGALLLLVLGTALVVLAVLGPGTLMTGVVLLDVAILALAAAGVLKTMAREP